MDKTAIKSFAIESRRHLIENVKYQASLIGITADGISEPISKAEGMETYDYGAGTYTIFDEDILKRENLVKEVMNKGFGNVVEEVAYTWFNRIIAIRFMEVNDYLPTRTRVLSSEISGKSEPDIITEALDLDLNYSDEDLNLILKYKEENKLDDLFQFLFVKQCNKLNDILPGLFEETDDYMELLLDISFINDGGIIRLLIDNISEEDFQNQVEIIGWLYQYYITDLNNLIYDGSYKKEKISKEMLPFATQIFTPNWIVKYMVENSLGKLWLDNNPNSNLQNKFKYFIETNPCHEDLNIEEIKIIDPCMGSGHILVYVFDVLMNIYSSIGYSNKDAVISILKNNVYGLDIDDRAYQLAYFAIMMKAREHYRRIFKENISINLHSIQESNNINSKVIDYVIQFRADVHDELIYIYDIFKNAKEYGSILNIKQLDFNNLINVINDVYMENSSRLLFFEYQQDLNLLKQLIQQAKLLNAQYEVVVTNPPYLNSSRFNPNLVKFAKKEYKDVSSDLSMMMYKKAIDSFAKPNGYISFITTNSWMFLAKFEELRNYVLKSIQFESIVDLGSELFEGKVGHNLIVSWVNKNIAPSLKHDSIAINLTDYNYSNKNMKQTEFFNEENRYLFNQNQFNKIPGYPIAYAANDSLINCFNNDNLSSYGFVKQGLATADNKRFLRFWFEIDFNNIGFSVLNTKNTNKKWFPYNKGGSFRKWWGNQDYVINWENDGEELKNFKKSVLRNSSFYFNESLSWSKVSSGKIAFRYYPNGFIFDVAGCSVFLEEHLHYIFGFLNSNICETILDLISPTLNYEVGHISSLPIIIETNKINDINNLVLENINLCKQDWDDYEISWNFKRHPLLMFNKLYVEDSFIAFKNYKREQFEQLKINEIRLNNIFSEIYGVDVDKTMDDKYISISSVEYEKDMKSFISYSVGCIFGRYDLNETGVISSGFEFDLNDYSKFIPDDDNIIPILDTEYFDDDIVGRFVEFVKVCFGEESLEENLDFISGALNKKGKTSREIIRNYFLTDFFKDHSKLYKKCPIYWQFDSGKQNAFKCLIYMHRYDPSIVARVRTDYLHKTQKAIEQNVSHCDNVISNSSNKSEISKATKDKSKFIKQLDEIKVYDEALRHIAAQNIEIDLDNGVKVNYSKFQNVEISKEGEKPKKINLLKNI